MAKAGGLNRRSTLIFPDGKAGYPCVFGLIGRARCRHVQAGMTKARSGGF
jgi:hypothetical protein